MLKAIHIPVVTSGGAGVAAGTADSTVLVVGELVGVYLKYNSQPATTDVTLKTKGASSPSYNLLVVTNGNTSGYFAPRAKPVDNANGAITNAHDRFPVSDFLTLSVAQGDNGAPGVEAWALIDDGRDKP